MLHDLRHAVRLLARYRGLTATAVLVMAIGIGGNAAVFSVIHAVSGATLPHRRPSDTLLVYAADAKRRGERWLSYPDYRDVRSRADLFTAVAAVGDGNFISLVEHGRAETLLSEPFSASVFDVLRVTPTQGRAFRADEDEPGGPLVAMLGHAVWARRFGSDPAVIGRAIRLNGHAVTIVGVGPPGFRGTFGVIDTEVWVPWGTAAVDVALVSHAYFDVLGLPIRAGRGFSPADRHPDAGPAVAVVSAAMATRFWGSTNPVGATFVMGTGADRKSVRVVGIATDAPALWRRDPVPFFYLPFPGGPTSATVVLARSGGQPHGLPALMRREIAAVDPGLPVLDAATMETRASLVHYVPRMLASLLAGFGLVTMLVALVGLYGLVASSVAQRLKELSIRAALGAQPHHILWSVLGDVCAMTAVGLGIGLPLGGLATRPLQQLLEGVSWADPLALAGVAVFVSAATIGATLRPARGVISAGAMAALRDP